MYTMKYDIQIGDYSVGMLDKVEIHRSVELLSDTCLIVLPGSEYNKTLEIESKIKRGDKVKVSLGYEEVGLKDEFTGWVQRIGTDDGSISIECEDDLFLFRKDLPDKQYYSTISLDALLKDVIKIMDLDIAVDSTYEYKYDKFIVRTATGYDVLKKVHEETGADIYLENGTLHLHAPAERVGNDVLYDFTLNVEECDLTYRKAEDRKLKVIVKATTDDGKIKELEIGSTGGDSVTVKSPSADILSMQLRGESELKRLSFDGYEGNITTWLVPYVGPGDCAELHDRDYSAKDGRYFVQSVTTEFSRDGGKRKVELGFRLS